jgi:hypothetical protein
MGSAFEICCPPADNFDAPAVNARNDDSEEEVKVVIDKPNQVDLPTIDMAKKDVYEKFELGLPFYRTKI